MSALNDKLLATSQGEELIETLRSLPYDDLLHIIPLLQHLHAHIESAPGQYAAARAGNFLKLVKSARLPSSILSETLYACRSADPVKPVKDSSNYTSTKTYRLDHIAFTEPNWPIDEFRRSFAQWEEESGHLMSYEQLRNKGAVLEGDVKTWTVVNVLEPVVHIMDSWLQHYIKKKFGNTKRAHLSYRGEYTVVGADNDAVDHAVLFHEDEGVPNVAAGEIEPECFDKARAILLWEDKIFGSLQNFYITSRRPVPYFVRMDPYVHGELCKIEAQFRKYVIQEQVPYAVHCDGRVVTGTVWDEHEWGLGKTGGAEDFMKFNMKKKLTTSQFGQKAYNRLREMRHKCQVMSTYNMDQDDGTYKYNPPQDALTTREMSALFIWMGLRDREYDL